MANGVFNLAKGRVNEYTNRIETADPSAARFQLKLLKAVADTDAALEDRDDFAAIIAVGGNDEADFTNYGGGKTLTSTELSTGKSGTTNISTSTDITWTAAGGATNNTTVKLIVCYDPLGTDVDANLIPLTHHDFAATTDGNDLIADFGASFFTAS